MSPHVDCQVPSETILQDHDGPLGDISHPRHRPPGEGGRGDVLLPSGERGGEGGGEAAGDDNDDDDDEDDDIDDCYSAGDRDGQRGGGL